MEQVFIPAFAGSSLFRAAGRECALFTGTLFKLKALLKNHMKQLYNLHMSKFVMTYIFAVIHFSRFTERTINYAVCL